jgi:hypothetical protein
MQKNLVEIDGDYFRSDLIAAIVVCPDGDDDAAAVLDVYMVGLPESISTTHESWDEAKTVQAEAVKNWAAHAVEIDGDYFRIDLIAAISIEEDEEDDSEINLYVYMVGFAEPVGFTSYDTWDEAQAAQAKATQEWLASL